MQPYYEKRGIWIFHGDCLEVLPALGETFESCITDPPYEIAFMGAAWDKRGISFDPRTWTAVLNALKPGAMLLSFGSPRTWHRMACAIEDAGFELRDTLMWLYAEGMPKSLDLSKAIDKAAGAERPVIGVAADFSRDGSNRKTDGSHVKPHAKQGGHGFKDHWSQPVTEPATTLAKLWNGWGSALKPAHEPIVLAMKPLDGTFAENAGKHGVAGLNIDGSRLGPRERTDYGLKDSVRTQGTAYGKVSEKADFDAQKGRWPANVILDKGAAALLDAQTGERVSHGGGTVRRGSTTGEGMGFKGEATGVSNGVSYKDRGGVSRFFYCAKADKDRGNLEYAPMPLFGIPASEDRNDHPSVKPLDLMRYLCVLTKTPSGGVLVDPFMGSGTTLLGARLAGRAAVGIEKEEKYCEIAATRLEQPDVR